MNTDDSAKTQEIMKPRVVPHTAERRARRDESGKTAYHELLNTIYDSVVLTNFSGTIIEANARAEHSLQLSKDELCELSITDVIKGMTAQLLEKLLETVTTDSYTLIETSCRRADDTWYSADVIVNKFRGLEDKVLCFFIRDTTARKEAEAELALATDQVVEAEKTQSRIETISTLFYEFNNPLQILMTMAETQGNTEYSKQVERIIDVLNRLQEKEVGKKVVDEDGTVRYDVFADDPVKSEEKCDPGKILIVDDEAMVRQSFVTALGTAFTEMTIDTAENGQEAVNMFRENRYGIIVMDIFMPVMDGEEAFENIKKVCEARGWKMPPVVFCSGFVVSGTVERLVGDSSYHTCLKKPFRIETLIDAVANKLTYHYPSAPTL
jgi:PAS domain S-box-containing protein